MSMNFRACALLVASTLFAVTSAHAMEGDAYIFGSSDTSSSNALLLNGSQTVNVSNSGWYRDDAFHMPSNQNYIAGFCNNCGGHYYNNFFVFDISKLTAPVTSATLTLNNFDVTAPLQYTLVDYKGSIDTLLTSNGDAGVYTDLGTGASYGGDLVSLAAQCTGSRPGDTAGALGERQAGIRPHRHRGVCRRWPIAHPPARH